MLLPNSIVPLLTNIKERFEMAFQPVFNNRTVPVYEPYYLTVIRRDVKMWLTSPSLFLYVKCENLTPLTTSPEKIKIVAAKIYKLPILEFQQPEVNYSHLFCITNFEFNSNLVSEKQVDDETNKLIVIEKKLLEFFNKE